jgi:hypothetical protein
LWPEKAEVQARFFGNVSYLHEISHSTGHGPAAAKAEERAFSVTAGKVSSSTIRGTASGQH